MITNDNKGTYLVKNGQKHDNVIYERPLDPLGPWAKAKSRSMHYDIPRGKAELRISNLLQCFITSPVSVPSSSVH